MLLLKAGELVAIPTETVYGLAADAYNPEAVKKIFDAKGRPANHPVIVHIYEINQLKNWVESIPEFAYSLIKHFWPGPMTLIFPAAKHVPAIITGGQNTIGIRMPAHPVARELLKAFGGGIAAPSANRFGRISPTTAAHVREELGDKVKLILDGGPCALGLESTIIDLTHEPPRLLRSGPLTIAEIEMKSGIKVVEQKTNSPRVSGNLASHYAPTTPSYLMSTDEIRHLLLEKAIGIVALACSNTTKHKHWIQMPRDPTSYAHDLYAVLHKMDSLNLDKIIIESPPNTPAWQAVIDRLQKATYR